MNIILLVMMSIMFFCGAMAIIRINQYAMDGAAGWAIVAGVVFSATIGFIVGVTFGPMLS